MTPLQTAAQQALEALESGKLLCEVTAASMLRVALEAEQAQAVEPATGERAELVAFLREITTTLQPAHHIKQKANAVADMLEADAQDAFTVGLACQPKQGRDLPLDLLERLSKTLTRLGYSTPEGGIEHFGARIESQLYNLCRGVDSILAQQVAVPATGERAELVAGLREHATFMCIEGAEKQRTLKAASMLEADAPKRDKQWHDTAWQRGFQMGLSTNEGTAQEACDALADEQAQAVEPIGYIRHADKTFWPHPECAVYASVSPSLAPVYAHPAPPVEQAQAVEPVAWLEANQASNFKRTAAWLKACGKEPSAENMSVQVGCMVEEFCELLSCLRTDSEGYAKLLDRTRLDLEWFASKLKRRDQAIYIPHHLRTDALDALCDIEVTANGVAYLAEMDKPGADRAVLDSNDAKLVDGKPVILEGGKIGKPAGWTAPDLRGFV